MSSFIKPANRKYQVVEALVTSDPPFSKLPKAQQRAVGEIAAALVLLLGSLALSRDEVLESIVANRQILRFLFALVADEATPPDLLEDVLSCLMTLSEENAEFGQAAIDDQASHLYDLLLKLKAGTGLTAVYACGILHNIFYSLHWQDHSPGKDGACDAILIPTLARTLSQDLPAESTKRQGGPSPFESIQLAAEVVASIGTDLQATLEKASRSEARGQPESEWNGFENGADAMEEDGDDADNMEDEKGDDGDDGGDDGEDDDEEMGQDEMDADMDAVTGADHEELDGSEIDDLPTLKELLSKAIPQLVKRSQSPLNNDEAVAIQGHILSALNNIAWTVSCFDFAKGENESVYRAWAPAAKSIWSGTVAPILASDTSDVELATQITGLAWAIARSLGGNTPLRGNEHQRFMTLYQASKGLENTNEGEKKSDGDQDPLQGLGVKCIGVLGHLTRDPAPIDLNHEVGVFLNVVLKDLPETPAANAVEALNQLFDMYGDESLEHDKVFWKNNFLSHLEEVSPKVKEMAKAIDKRKCGELRAKADEVVLNLGRFIKYKRKHAP